MPKMLITSYITKSYDNNSRFLTMEKQTQSKPILPASMAGKIALSAVEGPVVSSVEPFIFGFLTFQNLLIM
jgi:hypothetical protein